MLRQNVPAPYIFQPTAPKGTGGQLPPPRSPMDVRRVTNYDAQADVPSARRLWAQLAFKDSMIHGILQFTPSIAFRYVLHRCKSLDIRCQESFCFTEGAEHPSRNDIVFLGTTRAGGWLARWIGRAQCSGGCNVSSGTNGPQGQALARHMRNRRALSG